MLQLGSVSCSVVSRAGAARGRAGAGPRPAGAEPARLSSRLEAGTAGSRASRAINPSTTTWASRSTSGSTIRTGWSGSSLGELVKEPTRYQLLSDARSWDAGPRVERQVAQDDKVRATSLALPRVYARCLPRMRCHRSHRGHWDRPSRPKLDLRRRRAHGELRGGASPAPPWRYTAGAWPARLRGCRPAVCPPARSRLAPGAGEIAWSTGQTWRVSTHTCGAAQRRPAMRAGNRGRGRGRTQTVPGRPYRRRVR